MPDVEQQLRQHFRCEKCDDREAEVKRISASGTGLSKMLDIQHNHFVIVVCQQCGHAEMYDESVLEGRSDLGNVMDVFFG
jgi:predicted nucleic-acid-binding Zn-ribbon protein